MVRARKTLPTVASSILLAFALAAAAPTMAAARDAQPFHAAFGEQFGAIACPSGTPASRLCASVTGIGGAVGIVPGPVNEAALAVVDLTQFNPITQCAPDVAAGTLTNGNGDHVNVVTTGTFCRTSATTATDSGTFQISGGTGRLTGITASGSFSTRAFFQGGQFAGRAVTIYQGTIHFPND